MNDIALGRAIDLLDEMLMWRKLATYLPVDAPERWSLSLRFLKTRRELEHLLEEASQHDATNRSRDCDRGPLDILGSGRVARDS